MDWRRSFLGIWREGDDCVTTRCKGIKIILNLNMGKEKHKRKTEWIDNIEKRFTRTRKRPWGDNTPGIQSNAGKSTELAYKELGSNNFRPSMTNWLLNWIDALKKQIYPNGWLRRTAPPQLIPKKEPLKQL